MKNLKILLKSGVIKSDKELHGFYKKFKFERKHLKSCVEAHKTAKIAYKEAKNDDSCDNFFMELIYMEKMATKHERIAAEYYYLLAESELEAIIKEKIKDKTIKKLTGKFEKKNKKKEATAKSDESSESVVTAKSSESVPSKTPTVSVTNTARVISSESHPNRQVSDPFVVPRTPEVVTVSAPEQEEVVAEEAVEPTPKKRGPKPGFKRAQKEAAASLEATTLTESTPEKKTRKPRTKTASPTESSVAPEKKTKTSTKSTSKEKAPAQKKTTKGVVDQAGGDDLSLLKGMGASAVRNFNEIGITTFQQIASFTPAEMELLITTHNRRMAVLPFETLQEQAILAAAGKWDELSAFVATLKRGRL